MRFLISLLFILIPLSAFAGPNTGPPINPVTIRQVVGNSNCTFLWNTDNTYVLFNTAFTQSQSCLLPAANSVSAGTTETFQDDGAVNLALGYTLTINTIGSDKIDPGTLNSINFVLVSPGYTITFISNGSNGWNISNFGIQTLNVGACINSVSTPIQDVGTISGKSPVALHTGNYTLIASDQCSTQVYTGSGGSTFTLMAPSPGVSGWIINNGSGNITVTTPTGYINNSGTGASITLPSGNGLYYDTDGNNYYTQISSNSSSCSGDINSACAVVQSVGGGYPAAFPQGRISDQTSCAHGSDSATITTLYYVAGCPGTLIPISTNGTSFTLYAIPATTTNLSTANSTNFPANTIFDFYATIESGNVTYCAVRWSTNTAGASARGAGAALTNLQGILVNSGTPGCSNGSTAYTLVAKEATYLGTFVTTATAQDVAMQFNATPAAGGPSGGAYIGYANYYNKLVATCTASDSTSSWTYAAITWAALDSGATGSGLYNRCYWVDPVGSEVINAVLVIEMSAATTASPGYMGIAVNSVTTPSAQGTYGVNFKGTVKTELSINSPQSSGGLNYVQAMQFGYNGTVNINYTGKDGSTGIQAEALILNGTY